MNRISLDNTILNHSQKGNQKMHYLSSEGEPDRLCHWYSLHRRSLQQKDKLRDQNNLIHLPCRTIQYTSGAVYPVDEADGGDVTQN